MNGLMGPLCAVPGRGTGGAGDPHPAGPRGITRHAGHGLDHAQTLAVVLPALLQAKREQKCAKLLQYAERVWDLRSGSDEARIDGAIAATRDFFERMGIKTRLRDYVADAGSTPCWPSSKSTA